MGKKSVELERELADHRRAMTDKRRQLDERVRDDVRDLKSGIADEITSRTRLSEYVEKRPLATMAAAFGTGVLLGAVSDSGDEPSSRRVPRGRGASNGSGGAGLLSGLLGTITGPLGNTVQDELRSTIRDFLGRDDERPVRTNGASSNTPMHTV
jgi:hypothetical protein